VTELFSDWTPVPLHSSDKCPASIVRFPVQAYPNYDLPPLIVVRRSKSHTPHVAGTGWWGSAEYPRTADAVRAHPDLCRKLSEPDQATGKPLVVDVARARRRDVVRYADGFLMRACYEAAVAALAAMGAAAAFLTISAPVGVVLGLVAFAGLVAIASAVRSIRATATRS
jgi:hypothetical protein